MNKPRRLKYSAWIGRIGERVAKEELEKKGYKVTSMGWPVPACKDCETLEGQVKKCYVDLPPRVVSKCPFGENWVKLVEHAKEVMASAERTDQTHGVFCDFYATKNGEKYLIEVKADSGRLSRQQKKVLNYAKELGYKVLIVKVKIDLLLKDFQIEVYGNSSKK